MSTSETAAPSPAAASSVPPLTKPRQLDPLDAAKMFGIKNNNMFFEAIETIRDILGLPRINWGSGADYKRARLLLQLCQQKKVPQTKFNEAVDLVLKDVMGGDDDDDEDEKEQKAAIAQLTALTSFQLYEPMTTEDVARLAEKTKKANAAKSTPGIKVLNLSGARADVAASLLSALLHRAHDEIKEEEGKDEA